MADKKNKDIVIDGVRYKLSPADWKLQQQILSRATVVQDDKAPQGKSALTSEKLNDMVVNRLVGHTNVVYYNCETNAWNTNTYNNHIVRSQKQDTQLAKAFGSVMEKIPKFSQTYEFIASVTMTINSAAFPGWAERVVNPQYSKTGTAVVGNIIVKNKATGKYELYCKSWVGVDIFCDSCLPVLFGANKFALDGVGDSVFREALMRAHAR